MLESYKAQLFTFIPNFFPQSEDCDTFQHQSQTNEKVVDKSCGLCAIFKLFGAAAIQVRLLIESGLQCFESAKPMKAVWHDVTCRSTLKAKLDTVNVTKLFQNVSRQFGMQKTVEFSPTWATLGHHFQAAAYVQVEFGESVASI